MFAWLRQAVLLGVLRQLDPSGRPSLDEAFGASFQDVTVLRLRALDTLRALDAEVSEGPQVSIDKLLLSRAEMSVQDLVAACRPIAIDDGSPSWSERAHDFLYSRSAPIYGGSVEIQRTIIAGQILGLGKAGQS